MAATNLPVSPSPGFPQHLFRQLLAESLLDRCDWEDQLSECRARATVHHLESSKEYCLAHHAEVSRG